MLKNFQNSLEAVSDEEINHIISCAEALLGKADDDSVLVGIAYRTDGKEYPEIISTEPNGRGKIILLTESSKNDILKTLYQLCHEVVHLISFSEKSNVTVLEEGCAVYLSIHYLKNKYAGCDSSYSLYYERCVSDLQVNAPNYYEAYCLVKSVFESQPNVIKQARCDNAIKLSKISGNLIKCSDSRIFQQFVY